MTTLLNFSIFSLHNYLIALDCSRYVISWCYKRTWKIKTVSCLSKGSIWLFNLNNPPGKSISVLPACFRKLLYQWSMNTEAEERDKNNLIWPFGYSCKIVTYFLHGNCWCCIGNNFAMPAVLLYIHFQRAPKKNKLKKIQTRKDSCLWQNCYLCVIISCCFCLFFKWLLQLKRWPLLPDK